MHTLQEINLEFFSFMPEWQISHDYKSNAEKLQLQASRGPKGRDNGIILNCNMIGNVLVEFWLKFPLNQWWFSVISLRQWNREGTSFGILENLIIHVFLNVLTKLRENEKTLAFRKRLNPYRIAQPIRSRHCITLRTEHYEDHLDDNKYACFSLYQNRALKCVVQ